MCKLVYKKYYKVKDKKYICKNVYKRAGWVNQIDFYIKGGQQGGGGQHNTPTFTILFYVTIAYYKYIVTG